MNGWKCGTGWHRGFCQTCGGTGEIINTQKLSPSTRRRLVRVRETTIEPDGKVNHGSDEWFCPYCLPN